MATFTLDLFMPAPQREFRILFMIKANVGPLQWAVTCLTF